MNNLNKRFVKKAQYVDGSFHIREDKSGILYNPVSQEYLFTEEGMNLPFAAAGLKGQPSFVSPIFKKYRIEVTENCNANCSYCVVYKNPVVESSSHGNNMNNRNMTPDTAAMLIIRFNAEIGQNGSIMVIGGEPLVNWPAVKIIIEQSESPVDIFTNAVGITDEVADIMAKYNARAFISLDGSDRKSNRFRVLNNGDEMFSHALRGYYKLRDHDVNFAINLIINN